MTEGTHNIAVVGAGRMGRGIALSFAWAGNAVALALRGDHSLNLLKAAKLEAVADPLTLIAPERVQQLTGAPIGSIGPAGLNDKEIPVIADHAAAAMSDFVCGANTMEQHAIGMNWGRDIDEPTHDLLIQLLQL